VAAPEQTPVFTLDAAAVAARFGVDPQRGLTSHEAQRRLQEHGDNAFREPPPRPILGALLGQFRDPLVLVLLAAAALASATGDAADAALILAIVAIDAAIGCTQELRADRAVRSLRALLPAFALVRRDGEAVRVPQREVVPGDIVLLDAGAVVPADARLCAAHALATQEAALTGESLPCEKAPTALSDLHAPLADRACMAWKGTLVVRGRGEGIVTATGMRTELGRIASLLRDEPEAPTPLQRRLAAFGRNVSLLVVFAAATLFALGVLRGEPTADVLMLAISLAVAAIPEALPAVITIGLALAARRMAARNALVRKLPAVETLGSVTFVCTDKTGTLTENRMRVRSVFVDGRVQDERALAAHDHGTAASLVRAFCVSNDVARDGDALCGDPTEVALAEAARAAADDAESALTAWPRAAEIPFDAGAQRMTTVHTQRDACRWLAITKGSPESVLPLCAMTAEDRERASVAARAFASTGKRVLAFAETCGDGDVPKPSAWTEHLRFLGLAALEDPPRPSAKAAVRACRNAGIVPVMITGDHPATARAIAEELGMLTQEGAVVTGKELATWSDAALDRALDGAHKHGVAFARTAPEQKIRIVKALQRRGEVVAMTGDGVNDAPALQQADIGVAMGLRGSDVAREASDLALLDDDFATIPAAVEEGRRMHDSVRRFLRFLMTGNTAELMTISVASIVAMPAPLLPVHILWVNLVTDGLPGLLLANEPAEPDSMARPPRPARESLFAHGMLRHIAVFGTAMATFSLLGFFAARHDGDAAGRTLAFTTLVCCQLAHALVVRSEQRSLFGKGWRGNTPLLLVVLGSFALQLLVVYTPIGNRLLHTQPLDPSAFGLVFAAAFAVVLGVEAEKARARRNTEPAAKEISSTMSR